MPGAAPDDCELTERDLEKIRNLAFKFNKDDANFYLVLLGRTLLPILESKFGGDNDQVLAISQYVAGAESTEIEHAAEALEKIERVISLGRFPFSTEGFAVYVKCRALDALGRHAEALPLRKLSYSTKNPNTDQVTKRLFCRADYGLRCYKTLAVMGRP